MLGVSCWTAVPDGGLPACLDTTSGRMRVWRHVLVPSPLLPASHLAGQSGAGSAGRVFAFRRTIAMSASIVAPLLAAPLADYVFKRPWLRAARWRLCWVPLLVLGRAGIGVLISAVGVIIIATTLIALGIRAQACGS